MGMWLSWRSIRPAHCRHRFDSTVRQGIFLPESPFGADSSTVSVHHRARINISAHVKYPVVHVRVRWIMETLKHPACTVGWVARQLAFNGEGNPNFPWEKFHRDNTVVQIKKKKNYGPSEPKWPRSSSNHRLVFHTAEVLRSNLTDPGSARYVPCFPVRRGYVFKCPVCGMRTESMSAPCASGPADL